MEHSHKKPTNPAVALVATSLLVAASLGGCASGRSAITGSDPTPEPAAELRVATFAGGCFWCVESAFEELPGVSAVVSGYTGGPEASPTYEEVSSGRTGHTEAVQITYDPSRIRYEGLLWHFWRQIDPTDGGGQFVDRGSQYRPAIFTHSDEQRRLAEASRAALDEEGPYESPIALEIHDGGPFYPAEDYHQDYYRTHPESYHRYRAGSGRDQYLARVWGEAPHGPNAFEALRAMEFVTPTEAELRQRLTELQFDVTQQDATERAFRNEYWDHHDAGVYVDVVSGEPLFASGDKFDSGTGWPSFVRPLVADNVVERVDSSLGVTRTEVRSRIGDSHLGHLFDDGPQPTGLRYCINSAALIFVPSDDLVRQGYGELARLL